MRLAAIVSAILLLGAPAYGQDRFAAQASNNESNAPVVWGSTSSEAFQKALAACNAISDTCGQRPAVTSDMTRTFVTMCCTSPRLGCSIAGTEAAVRQTFANAGYSSCRVTRRVNAGTGR